MFSNQMGHLLPITYLCLTSHLQSYYLPTYQPTTHLLKCTPYLLVHPPITYLHINYLPTNPPTHLDVLLIHPHTYLYTHPLTYILHTHPFAYLFTHPPTQMYYLSTHTPTYIPTHLHTYYIPTHLPIYLPTHPPIYLPTHPSPTNLHYYNSQFFKRFKLTDLSFSLMDMYILTKSQRLEGHMYLLTNQLDYSGSFD